ncbi:uncharacterized protein [Coffea arabica]|uniref:Uncharacterized protein n=1 Tax=Coffea arabica TaxID=13443 RepID=A0A6P6VNJ2_COFAR|nr:uncharacterized protein LOC113725548 [Coffea arabica]
MATLPSSTFQLSNPNPLFPSSSPRTCSPLKLHAPPSHSFTIITRATSDDSSSDETDQTQTESPGSDSDVFENRLSQVRLRYKSGTGKKAEVRKTRKGKKGASSSSSGSGMYLPPVPLKEAVSEGLNVEFGFSPYSERVNGRIALIGLTALILVELATGQGVIKYHSPAIILIQVYFMAAASALYVKYEKEKVSVWPRTQSSASSSSSSADK